MSSSAPSMPSAIAGTESVIRFIHNKCTGLNTVNPIIVAANIVITSLRLLESRNCMVFLILSYILLPSSTADTIVAKLSSASTMSATFLVTSVPVMPMPIPILADFMLGASLTPSPVIAVIFPSSFHAFTILTLCSGCTRAYTLICFINSGNCPSDISSSVLPVTASLLSEIIPSSNAIATAVSR